MQMRWMRGTAFVRKNLMPPENPLPREVQAEFEARKAECELNQQLAFRRYADELRERAKPAPPPTVEEQRGQRAILAQAIADRIATLGHAD